jgi:hypothetical protein
VAHDEGRETNASGEAKIANLIGKHLQTKEKTRMGGGPPPLRSVFRRMKSMAGFQQLIILIELQDNNKTYFTTMFFVSLK